MSAFYLYAGTPAQYPTRCGWSDWGIAYGGVSADAPTTVNGVPIVDCYYDSADSSLNVTIGASVGLSPVTPYNWDSETAYTPGQLVLRQPDGYLFPALFYMCIQSSTNNAPEAPSPDYWALCPTYPAAGWDTSDSYVPGQKVTYGSAAYECLQANTGVEPPNFEEPDTAYWRYLGPTLISPPLYDSSLTYYAGAIVSYLGTSYTCIGTTTGNVPPNATYWTPIAAPVPYTLADFELYYLEIFGPLIVPGTDYLEFDGAWETPVIGANGNNFTVSTETELGPGFTRYSWRPTGLVPSTPNSPPLPVFTQAPDDGEYASYVYIE